VSARPTGGRESDTFATVEGFETHYEGCVGGEEVGVGIVVGGIVGCSVEFFEEDGGGGQHLGKVRDELGEIKDDVDQHPADGKSSDTENQETIQPGTESIMEMVIFHAILVIMKHAVKFIILHRSYIIPIIIIRLSYRLFFPAQSQQL